MKHTKFPKESHPLDAAPSPTVAHCKKLKHTRRDNVRHFDLNRFPRSDAAKKLADELCIELSDGLKSKPQSAKFRKAVGTIIATLIREAAEKPDAFLYRPMGAKDFTGAPVGFRSFKPAIEQMVAMGYVAKEEALCPATFGAGPRKATRFKATPKLIGLAAKFGIKADEWSSHFSRGPRPAKVENPILLKASSRWDKYGNKFKGKALPVDYSHPLVQAEAEQVNQINAFMAPQVIEPDVHYGFHRIFNQGDDPAFEWNKGGRLYSIGEGGYQSIEKHKRRDIKINGERTVEIDVKASHLTILHGLMGLELPTSHDPYEIPGIARDVVKSWVTMTLGNDGFQTRWSGNAKEDYSENRAGRKLQDDFPLKATREKILNHLPILKDWDKNSIRWGDLQYVESCVIIDTVHELATAHEVAALPVHDSLIVPISNKGLAEEVLKNNFKKYTGVFPRLDIK